MTNFFTIRNYRPGDFRAYARLHVEADRFDRSGRYISSRALAEGLGRPNYSPEKDLFIVETDRKITGYIGLTPELGIGRVLLDCLVHPRYRRKGMATKLFPCAMQRAKELGAKLTQISIPETNVAAKSLVSNLGFKFIRRFLELKMGFYNIRLPDVKHVACIIRQLRSGEENKLTEIQNRSFLGTWGFNPNTTEEILYRINLRGCAPEDVIMAYEGDRPIGYCWTKVGPEKNAAGREAGGQIHMMGVDPDYQEKGIGKEILLTGLAHLRSKGIEVVKLTVDSENQPARSLYGSVGFEVCSTTEWYEKAVS
ncbi:MAG: GNAT family N-acetyltransferase [Desulfobacterales bacterium]|nr:GNAT family N-acetyltransferase [Desulfobacterales bacterium]